MDINMITEVFTYPSYLDPNVNLEIKKRKTKNNIDIVTVLDDTESLYEEFAYKDNVNILDFQSLSEFEMSHYARHAVKHLPKKDNIIVGYTSEALNSTYWNVVFDILQEAGYKKILWIDGGMTQGAIFRHLHHLKVFHFQSTMFYNTLFRSGIGENIPPLGSKDTRTLYYVSLGRLARQERIYFTKKLLNDEELYNKGVVTCGWGDSTLHVWENTPSSRHNINMLLQPSELEKFPISLGHADDDQHQFFDTFNSALFNVVQESSIGADPRSSDHHYKPLSPMWQTVNSDRVFFTEKSAKPFLMNQIPLFIAAPGMVQVLRNLGFDMFDDIVDHSYDKEDNMFKRCDMVYNELKRLTSIHTLEAWNSIILERHFNLRFFNNSANLRNLGCSYRIIDWYNKNF